MNDTPQSPAVAPAPDPWKWFDELVKEHPGAESYRPNFDEIRTRVPVIIQELQSEVARAQESENQADRLLQERYRQFMVEIATSAFDKQSTYTTAILSVGYVGLFAAWNLTAQSLPPMVSRFVVVTALSSLVVLILFEVFKMIHGQLLVMRTLKLARTKGKDFDTEVEKYQMAQDKAQPWFYTAWIVSIFLTLTLGLMSAGAIIYAHLEKLFFPAIS